MAAGAAHMLSVEDPRTSLRSRGQTGIRIGAQGINKVIQHPQITAGSEVKDQKGALRSEIAFKLTSNRDQERMVAGDITYSEQIQTANEIKLDSGSTADSMEMERFTMWQRFAGLGTPNIQDSVEFAKRVPGFLEFAQDDQLILIKLGFFEVWLIHVSRSILAEEYVSRGAVTFAGGAYVTREQLEFVFDIDFTSSMFNFFSSFNGLSLNDTEIGLFCAVALLSNAFSERTTLFDARTVEQCQARLVEALKLQVIRNHPSDQQLFSQIIAKLPELRQLGNRHADHLQWFRTRWERLSHLQPSFAEIFDIPLTQA
ncbi:ecdysone-induced protein 78C-like [Galendromus occidentalis]|uniref:Ecdysone-induced protein 78C-like n=1 Tax=Galendromus occidentalis TaxID=34638 RepID=A0AAJ7PAU0_9ACAR|nr:ecdysone-induced protein 78C-like [Galendromus occidentalis]